MSLIGLVSVRKDKCFYNIDTKTFVGDPVLKKYITILQKTLKYDYFL